MLQIRGFASTPGGEIRFTLGLVGATLLVINAVGWLFYMEAGDYMERQSKERLISVASALAAQIDRDRVLAFSPGDEETSEYRDERNRLIRLRDEAALDNVFLFAPFYGNLIDTRPGVAIGDIHPLSDIESQELSPLWDGIAVGLPLHEIGGERFQSAFVPIVEEDELLAVVGADASARFLSDLERIRRGLLATAALSLVLAAALGFYVHRNTRRLVDLHGEIKNREKLAALGTLTAGLAHEIRNPLSIIRASAELLQEEEAERGEVADHQFGTGIVEEVDRLSTLLTSFLDFARPSELEAEKEDFTSVVTSTLDRIEPVLTESGIDLDLRLPDSKLPVRLDRAQIEQVLFNLVLNAKDAVDGSGKIGVSLLTRRRARHGARFPGEGPQQGEYAEVTVEDNGCGMTPEQMSRLFDPFFTTKEKGTGLGLSIVHGIIGRHNGYLFVESDREDGTRVGFGLPA